MDVPTHMRLLTLANQADRTPEEDAELQSLIDLQNSEVAAAQAQTAPPEPTPDPAPANDPAVDAAIADQGQKTDWLPSDPNVVPADLPQATPAPVDPVAETPAPQPQPVESVPQETPPTEEVPPTPEPQPQPEVVPTIEEVAQHAEAEVVEDVKGFVLQIEEFIDRIKERLGL